jgi:hypothetical protein
MQKITLDRYGNPFGPERRDGRDANAALALCPDMSLLVTRRPLNH